MTLANYKRFRFEYNLANTKYVGNSECTLNFLRFSSVIIGNINSTIRNSL